MTATGNTATASKTTTAPADGDAAVDLPSALFIIGMAGSGKSTLVHALQRYFSSQEIPEYTLNLDPATLSLPYADSLDIDIRDSIDYHQVMQQYGLGPNGAIVTCLNLWATKVCEVVDVVERRVRKAGNHDDDEEGDPDDDDAPPPPRYILLDTPGQIEVFAWSASGEIITQAFASAFPPPLIVYVMDAQQSAKSLVSLMSGLMNVVGVMVRMGVEVVVALNKCDLLPKDSPDDKDASEFDFTSSTALTPGALMRLCRDADSLQTLLDHRMSTGEEDLGYMSSLIMSMSNVLEELYENVRFVPVSAESGHGVGALVRVVDEVLAGERKKLRGESAERQQQEMHKLLTDLALDEGGGGGKAGNAGSVE